MKFELLPNEIFIECFEYFNVFEIYYSFDELNFRLNKLIRNISLYIDFQNVRKKTFDQFCTKILSNPEIKTQIISLKLSNKDTCGQIDRFLSLFSLDEFSYLQSLTLIQVQEKNTEKLKTILPLIPQLYSFRMIDSHIDISNALPYSKLQTLYMPRLDFLPIFPDNSSSIINLTIYYCSFDKLSQLFKYLPILKYLNIQHISDYNHSQKMDITFTENYGIHLKELIITEIYRQFNDFEMFIKQIPNLKNLTINSSNNIDMINAHRWEDLIKFSLPCLDIFKFKFRCSFNYNQNLMIDKLKQFQSDFWQKEHQWFIEYSLIPICFIEIYTIPYAFKTFDLFTTTNNNSNTFNNVTDLILRHGTIKEHCQYHFSNVKSLKLEYINSSSNNFEEINYIQSLKMIVNLSNLRKLDITFHYMKQLPLILLNILKEAPYLSSISIDEDSLTLLFENKELCEYLNKMIKNLDIHKSKSSLKIQQLCQICSNIEQLKCYIDQPNDLLFLLNHLLKLSTMKLYVSSSHNYNDWNLFLKDEAQKLNFMFHINNSNTNEIEYTIWNGKTMN